MSDSFDKVLEPYMACRPVGTDNDKIIIADLLAANDEMRRLLDEKDFTLAEANREIQRLRDEIMQIITK